MGWINDIIYDNKKSGLSGSKLFDTLMVFLKQVFDIFISSPEPKAQGELIVWDWSRRASVRPCVHTFKHEYL